MGNALSAGGHRQWRRRNDRHGTDVGDHVAHQLFVKPSGLYPTCQWDDKTVRRLILRSELAPRYPGKDEADAEAREECPICMLVYPMLNVTRCCAQRLCTECYLQLRPPRHSKEPCPFCKHRKVEVQFHGPRAASELDREEAAAREAAAAVSRSRDCPTPAPLVRDQQQQQQHLHQLQQRDHQQQHQQQHQPQQQQQHQHQHHQHQQQQHQPQQQQQHLHQLQQRDHQQQHQQHQPQQQQQHQHQHQQHQQHQQELIWTELEQNMFEELLASSPVES